MPRIDDGDALAGFVAPTISRTALMEPSGPSHIETTIGPDCMNSINDGKKSR